MKLKSKLTIENGIILLIEKDELEPMRDILTKVSNEYMTKKVGHNGTLDDFASGLVMIGIGEGLKSIWKMKVEPKEYTATMLLGVKTDTGDYTGQIIQFENKPIDNTIVTKVFEDFPKQYIQTTPIYSAIKVRGKKLHEYARSGNTQNLILPKRVVDVELRTPKISAFVYDRYPLLPSSFSNINSEFQIIEFTSQVSTGAYIRQLAQDISDRFGSISCLITLRRTGLGDFKL